MALMNLTVVPMGTKTTSISQYVKKFHSLLKQENATFTLTDMGTIIEGDAPSLFALAQKIHLLPFDNGILRVLTSLTIDDRRDKSVQLGDKIKSVQN